MLTYVIRMRKREVEELSNIPFETNAEGEIQNEVGF
jgi:hypothetical protein